MLLLLPLLLACDEPAQDQHHAVALSKIPATVEPVTESEWLQDHWTFPVPAQGDAPADWAPIEASLDPTACGTCHPAQYADWKDSWHAIGMGPGVMGQLVDWDGSDDRTVLQCQRCHAPLTEQLPRLKTGQDADGKAVYGDNPLYVADLRDDGLTCAGCHVRQHVRHGPPKDGRPADETGRALVDGPHDGFVPRDEYRDSSFCMDCHDFEQQQLALNDKLLQETTAEWARTSYAADGVTCQSCHMPEGRHLFRGIHDRDTVLQGVDVQAALTEPGSLLKPIQATLTLTNSGTGHRLPTYTTPEIKLFIWQVDEDGAELADTRREGSVGRRITPNLQKELYDTRLLPGEQSTLPYGARRHLQAHALVARVEVWPDEAYRRFYEIKLKKPENHPRGEAQLREALQASVDSRYTLWEQTIPL